MDRWHIIMTPSTIALTKYDSKIIDSSIVTCLFLSDFNILPIICERALGVKTSSTYWRTMMHRQNALAVPRDAFQNI